VIKILYSNRKGSWRDSEELYVKSKYLTEYIDKLVDKDNWTIIAATTEYIILQKMEEDFDGEINEYEPDKEAQRKIIEKK